MLDAVDAVDEHEHELDESGRMTKWLMMVSVVSYLDNVVGDVVDDDGNCYYDENDDCGDSSGDEVSVSSLPTLVVTGGTVAVWLHDADDGDDIAAVAEVVEVELDDDCDGGDDHDADGDDCCTCHHVLVPVVAVVQVQVAQFESWVELPHYFAAVAVEPSVEPPWPHCSHIDWEWSL